MKDDLKLIKKHYGECMMHLCRELFPTILEEEGLLFNLMSTHFNYDRDLYYDIVNNNLKDKFKDYIFGLLDIEINGKESLKSPKELLREVGYTLYECKSEEDIQSFIKYYAKGEELCTFAGHRLDMCYVFFAVRDGAEKLNRKDFINPERQDEYGTSVISIQFTKGSINTLSIKNRYNHRVKNPDATFSNNLENIVSGLSEAFEREYGYKINQNYDGHFELPSYVMDSHGKYYKYNYEFNNIYYCKDNIIINNFEVDDRYKDKEKYLFADYFIINLSSGVVSSYDYSFSKDAFLYSVTGIKNIQVHKDGDNKIICLKPHTGDNIYIVINNKNQILSYINNNIEFIGSNFLMSSRNIKYLELNNVKKVLHNFMYFNNSLEMLHMDKLESVDNFFLRHNNTLKELNFPSLKLICHDFLENNKVLERINLPSLEMALTGFLKHNLYLKELYLPSLEMLAEDSLVYNENLKVFYAPLLEKLKDNFLSNNNSLEELSLPSCKLIENGVLRKNKVLKKVCLPSLIGYEKSSGYSYRNQLLNDFLDENLHENDNRNGLRL